MYMYTKRYPADNCFFQIKLRQYIVQTVKKNLAKVQCTYNVVDADIVVMTICVQVYPFGVYNAMKILQSALRGVANKMRVVTLTIGLGKLKQSTVKHLKLHAEEWNQL